MTDVTNLFLDKFQNEFENQLDAYLNQFKECKIQKLTRKEEFNF